MQKRVNSYIKHSESPAQKNWLGPLLHGRSFVAFVAIAVVLFLSGCAEKKQDDTEMDECDPYAGFFKGGEHYIDADSVNEDGTINRRYMLKHTQKKLNPCDPRVKKFRNNMREKGLPHPIGD